jgi:hypothetical protein
MATALDALVAELKQHEDPLAALQRWVPEKAIAVRDAAGGATALARAVGDERRERRYREHYQHLEQIGWGNGGAAFQQTTGSKSIEKLRADYLEATTFDERAIDVAHETDMEEWVHLCASDLHLGPREVAYGSWLRLLEWIMETPNVSMSLNGDMYNTATKTAPGLGPAGDLLPFEDQRRLMFADLRPLADAGKLDFIGEGNHEDRLANVTGVKIWPAQDLAVALGVPYTGYCTFVRHRVNDHYYTGFHHHGCGSGQTLGYVLNTLERMAWNYRADYVAMGHRHQRFAVTRAFKELDQRGVVQERKVRLIAIGSYQRTANQNYAVKKNLSPSVIGAVGVRLKAQEEHGLYARE